MLHTPTHTHALDTLIQSLRRLPGVGVKSAQRMAFHLLQHDRAGANILSAALSHAAQNISQCQRCPPFAFVCCPLSPFAAL